MAEHHHHHHDLNTDQRLLGRAFVLIASFMLVELVVGLLSNALVLIADAGHMFLDAAALGFAWGAARMSARDEDEQLTYGYHRLQVLAGFVNALTLLALVVWISYEAIARLITPEPIQPIPALIVATLGLLVNLIAFRMLHGASDNMNVRSAALHVLGDLLGSVAAIVAALTYIFSGWPYADPLLAGVIVVILTRGAIRILRESTHILLEGTPDGVDLKKIKQKLCGDIPALVDIHHLHAWALTADKPLLTLHAQVEEASQVMPVTAQIKQILSATFGIDHSTVQVELGPCPDDQAH